MGPRLLGALVGALAWRRWTFLVLGGALLTPFGLLASVVLAALDGPGGSDRLTVADLALVLAACTPLALAAGLLGVLRSLETTAVRELLAPGGPRPDPAAVGRAPAAVFTAAHLVVGAVCSALALAGVPAALLLLASPLLPAAATQGYAVPDLSPPAAVLLGLAVLAGLLVLGAAASGGLAAAARWLLRPGARSRIADLERDNRVLSDHAALARELHDSVGHALAVVAVQTAAAERVLATGGDRGVVERALRAAGTSARAAQADLDGALGLLRTAGMTGTAPAAPAPTLADLGGLVEPLRGDGRPVRTTVDGDLAAVPPAASRVAYRVLQEALTNAVRHGTGRIEVTISAAGDAVGVAVTNDLDAAGTPAPSRPGGGSGIAGARSRVTELGGSLSAGPTGPAGTAWRLTARIPTGTP